MCGRSIASAFNAGSATPQVQRHRHHRRAHDLLLGREVHAPLGVELVARRSSSRPPPRGGRRSVYTVTYAATLAKPSAGRPPALVQRRGWRRSAARHDPWQRDVRWQVLEVVPAVPVSIASASQSIDAKMIPRRPRSFRRVSGGTELDESHQRDLPIGAALVVVVPRAISGEPGPGLGVVAVLEDLGVGQNRPCCTRIFTSGLASRSVRLRYQLGGRAHRRTTPPPRGCRHGRPSTAARPCARCRSAPDGVDDDVVHPATHHTSSASDDSMYWT